jgi:hypothetical protein
MKSVIAFLAFVAAASAQTWPMVTVDTSGNIVLQSTTKTKAFKLITTAVTAAGTTQATAAAIGGVSHATVSASSTTVGVTLPAAEAGFRVTVTKASSTAAFNLYALSGDQINNAASTTAMAVSATDLLVTCEAYDATNWLCESRDKFGGASGSVFVTSASVAPPSGTAPKRVGDLYVDTANKNLYFAKGTSNGLDYVQVGKSSSVPNIYTTTVRPGSGTATSTSGYGKPAKIGDILFDSTNTQVYVARGATNGYDWAGVVNFYVASAASTSTLMAKNMANTHAGDFVFNSYGVPSLGQRFTVRNHGTTTTGSVSPPSIGTFVSITNSA